MSLEVWYVRDRNRVTGPFDRQQLEALRQRGQLARFHQVSTDGQHWVSATTVVGLFATTTRAIAAEVDPPDYTVATAAVPEMWFYSTGKDPVGPVPADELLVRLRNGVLHADTLVWREGLPSWIPLRDSGLRGGDTVVGLTVTAARGRTGPRGGKNKISAALLAFFLGGIGIHKFYLGAWGWGLIYLIFFWTFIPALLAFIEFIVFLAMSDDSFDARYNSGAVTAFTW